MNVEEAQARGAYEAHMRFLGRAPDWQALTEQERGAWYVAAAAVLHPPKTEATPRPIDDAQPGHATRFDNSDEDT